MAGFDLMQNCDLPPPLKVFVGPNGTVFQSMNRISGTKVQKEEAKDDIFIRNKRGGTRYYERLELEMSSCLSQTRARGGEETCHCEKLMKERDLLSKALLDELLRSSAYGQWLKLLELQVSKLESETHQHSQLNEEDDAIGLGDFRWNIAVSLCLGIAGLGIAIGSKYLWFY